MVGAEQLKKEVSSANSETFSSSENFLRHFKSYLLNSTALGVLLGNGLRSIKHSFEDLTDYERKLEQTLAKAFHYVEEINNDLQAQGVQLVVLYIPNGNLYRDDVYTKNVKMNLMRQTTLRAFQQKWEKTPFIFVEPTAALEAAYINSGRIRSRVMLPVDGHHNGNGNQILAEETYKAIMTLEPE